MLRRSMLILGLVLLYLPTQAYGATLQYDRGSFAVTPYIYAQITEDSGGIPNPPIIGTYNPGPQVGTNTLSGSYDIAINGFQSFVQSHVSWNLQATYGKNFAVSGESHNWTNKSICDSDNKCSIRVDTQDGLVLKVEPEAGEKIGQTVKLFLKSNIFPSGGETNPDNDPAIFRLEAGDLQPNRINVNSISKYTFPLVQVATSCSSGDCYTWAGPGELGLQFHYESYDGPWPYLYNVWGGEPGEGPTIEAWPGELNHFDEFDPEEYLLFDYPITCKIGDLIELDLGFFQEISDLRSDLGGYPENFTRFDFTLSAQVVPSPLPGSVFLLGAGLLLLAGTRVRRRF
jgi:hypothetical protein